MYTVGALARTVGMSRTALLYYERIGLLPASARSGSRYRLYGEDARARLQAIVTYRGAGLGLRDIRALLDARGGPTAEILTARLQALDGEIARLREQQRVLVALLRNRRLLARTRTLDKRGWVAILAASGLDEAAMRRWHAQFEALAPAAHQDFLESLGIGAREIAAIRAEATAGR
jgi:DNA-binding transcriptional MerR regulator